MDKPTYRLQSSEDALQHVFESISNEKRISKVVAYVQSEGDSDLYQLIFGDLKENGVSISNNADMKIVLTTVISTLFTFYEKYSEATVVFTGSTSSRTRLYRAVIGKFINEAKLYFDVLGIKENGDLEPFDFQGDYIGYLIKQRQ